MNLKTYASLRRKAARGVASLQGAADAAGLQSASDRARVQRCERARHRGRGPGHPSRTPPESRLIALRFEFTETRGGPSLAHRVTITSVERDGSVIGVNYEIVPPLGPGSHRPRAEAKDDLGNDCRDLGGHCGLSGCTDSTRGADTRYRGRLNMPLPSPGATMLRIRIRWEASVIRMPWDGFASSFWERPAQEVRVSLADLSTCGSTGLAVLVGP